MPNKYLPYREILQGYGQDATKEILLVGQEGSPLVQELFKKVVKDDLDDTKILEAVSIEYVNKLEEAKATGFAEEIESEQFEGKTTSYIPCEYTKSILIHKNEYKYLERMETAEEILALEGFMKGKILPVADAMYRGMERDLLNQKTAGALGFDSLELMAGQGMYNGLDGTVLPYWNGHYFETTETMDTLLKYEDSESLTNNFLKHEHKQGNLLGKSTTPAVYVVGKNVFTMWERSLDRKGITQTDSGHPDILIYKGISIVKIDHPSWDTKMNKEIKIGKNALKLKANTNKILPSSFEDFVRKARTTNAYEFISIINAVLGVRIRTGLAIAEYKGLSADSEI